MENWQNQKIRKLIYDRGGEFLNQKFETLANECGVVHTFASPKTPEHNGFVERANHTILEKACCLMNPTSLPNQYSAEAINTEVFLLNLSPTHSRDGKYHQFLWSKIFLNLTRLQTFGCQSVIHNIKRQQDWELSSPVQEGILLGFENEGTAYHILRLDDLNIVVTRNATFNEKAFPSIPGKPNSVQWMINRIDELLPLTDIHTDTQREENSLYDPEDSLDVARYHETNNENRNGSDWSNEGKPNQFPDESSCDSPVGCSDHLNNETNSHSHKELMNIHKKRVKVIGPRHPTLITSNIDSMHILPY
ncbi:hypothetical protein O181_093304 [Austropuccinia psidii MF-1]|uniref:Integrase catalytic domain-containing protein n=1 Tax=Austropuccinia psidii MF-1 TaxID=1389203 RepID=A0A9Q3J0Y6_9BASI|nr:hypothetical protein [Austropuccinia psidii MF-1]